MVDAEKGNGEKPLPWVARPFHTYLDPGISTSVTGDHGMSTRVAVVFIGAVW